MKALNFELGGGAGLSMGFVNWPASPLSLLTVRSHSFAASVSGAIFILKGNPKNQT